MVDIRALGIWARLNLDYREWKAEKLPWQPDADDPDNEENIKMVLTALLMVLLSEKGLLKSIDQVGEHSAKLSQGYVVDRIMNTVDYPWEPVLPDLFAEILGEPIRGTHSTEERIEAVRDAWMSLPESENPKTKRKPKKKK